MRLETISDILHFIHMQLEKEANAHTKESPEYARGVRHADGIIGIHRYLHSLNGVVDQQLTEMDIKF